MSEWTINRRGRIVRKRRKQDWIIGGAVFALSAIVGYLFMEALK